MRAPDPAPPLLDARGLSFARDDWPVFGPLDLAVAPGEALLVLGGNGAGKTTLLRVLAGLLAPATGEVRFEGRAVDREHLAHGASYLGHAAGHKGELDAEANLRFAIGLGGVRPGRDIAGALAEVGLRGFGDAEARTLSAGQKKRLALARLWLSPARLWLLDEPYANLDLAGIALVDRLIGAHCAAGGACLVSTHGAYAAPPVPHRSLDLGGAHAHA